MRTFSVLRRTVSANRGSDLRGASLEMRSTTLCQMTPLTEDPRRARDDSSSGRVALVVSRVEESLARVPVVTDDRCRLVRAIRPRTLHPDVVLHVHFFVVLRDFLRGIEVRPANDAVVLMRMCH